MKRVIKASRSPEEIKRLESNRKNVYDYVNLLCDYNAFSDLYDPGDIDYWCDIDTNTIFLQYTDAYGYRASIFGAGKHFELKMFTNGEETFSKMYDSLRGAKIAMSRMSDGWKAAN